MGTIVEFFDSGGYKYIRVEWDGLMSNAYLPHDLDFAVYKTKNTLESFKRGDRVVFVSGNTHFAEYLRQSAHGVIEDIGNDIRVRWDNDKHSIKQDYYSWLQPEDIELENVDFDSKPVETKQEDSEDFDFDKETTNEIHQWAISELLKLGYDAPSE